jgi:glycosyltransferase involved in cell wall biosynthesis
MRIALVKPDFGVFGGFERVALRVHEILTASGHDVTQVAIPVGHRDVTPAYGVVIPPNIWRAAPHVFEYASTANDTASTDLSRFDAVISTQPPSFSIEHPRHISLFYHHYRAFYDLSDVYVAAGHIDHEVHAICQPFIHAVDQHWLGRVSRFLAGSSHVADRLRDFNGLSEGVSVFSAGCGVDVTGESSPRPGGPPLALCVSRQEFPKRTELFVQAMKHIPKLRGVLVGGGPRLPWVEDLDRRLSASGNVADLSAEELWLNRGEVTAPARGRSSSNVEFPGRVSDAELRNLYASATCVVAPAYLEDYGLTAIEAMARGKPVIVCRDGGGLTEIVEHEVDGLVVEPNGSAIAAAIDRLAGDPALAAEMGERGRAKATTYTWERAAQTLLDTVAAAAGAA